MANPIYTSDTRILNAKGFLSNLSRTTPTPEALYAYIAKPTPWSVDSNGVIGETPTDPTGSFADELVTRSEMMAMKRITAGTIAHVVPRRNWTSGVVYSAYSNSDAALLTKAFYVLTDDNNVYKCLNNNSGAPSTVKPTGTSTSNITLPDGYVWKFMFDITTSIATVFLTSSWLPVPTGGQKSSLQQAVENNASYSAGGPIGGHGSNAYIELGAYRLMVVFRFESNESGIFPVNEDYRKVGIVLNPELTAGGPATASLYTATNQVGSQINVNTGHMIYVEHIAPVTRNISQNEDYKLVLEF